MSLGRTTARTPETRAAFLEALAGSANITGSCRSAGIGRQTVYQWREEDEQFAKDWDSALEEAFDKLEAEAWRRGHDGVDKPITYQGQVTGTFREYSDKMLEILLKAHRPKKYVDRLITENTSAVIVKIEGDAAKL